MTVSLERIRDKLLPRFPKLEQVDDNILRFERTVHERAYAVCYVDVSKEIPGSESALDRYQERVVARRYFEGRKSLQWSNYLYFVVDEQPSQSVRLTVERDRKYARKFVLTEPEFHNNLTPPSFKVPDATLKTDILTTWTNILADAQLDTAILNDESLPRRLELIEEFFAQRTASPPRSSIAPRQSIQPFLRHIALSTFRQFPIRREFDLGTVTLICGANGTGKTSLMEAIELVYCGRTMRNPQLAEDYTIVARYSDGTEERASKLRQPTFFRERNLAWYGQAEQRTNNLYQMFSRFNFLNTDAAVGLAEGKEALEEDLSKLLVGPKASKTWNEIERTANKLDDKIQELASILNQAELEEASLNRQIAASGDLTQESGAVLTKLDAMLEGLCWRRPDGDSGASVKAFVEELSEYDIHIKEAISCRWAGAPVKIQNLREFITTSAGRIHTVEEELIQYRKGIATENNRTNELTEVEQGLSKLIELSKFMDAGMPELLAEVERLTDAITTHDHIFTDAIETEMQRHLLDVESLSVEGLVKAASAAVESSRLQLSASQKRYSDFGALRDESVKLAQRLRAIATQILETSAKPDTCPLCHTVFPPSELSKHMHADLDPQLEATAAAFLAEIRANQSHAELTEEKQKAAKWAERVCRRLGQPLSIAVSQLMKLVSNAHALYADQTQTRESLIDKLIQLETTGLRADRYRELLTDIPSLPSLERIKEECNRLEHERTRKTDERDRCRTQNQQMLRKAAEFLGAAEATTLSVESALAQLKEYVVTTKGVLSNLERCVTSLPYADDQPLSELAISVGAIRRLSGDYQATLAKEQNALAVLTESSSRKKQVETQISGLRPRIERFIEARSTLSKIQNEHSLSGAMEDALRENRNAIEAIFARIHSPAEFSGLGETLTTLVRRNSGGSATLQQISTGQRAAFALSLFLAQNAQLRAAPPLILIDDPIAHVDDLNCLSFMDYLREVVVADDRQVVFATANEKLATLFERKFDFLGEGEFRRYDLTR